MIKDLLIKNACFLWQRKCLFYIMVIAVLSILVVSGTVFVKHTSTPSYCNSCHIMNYQYESWFMTGLHRNITCVDCHLPNNNLANHLLWKGIDGMKDLFFFHTGTYAEPIVISTHGKKAVQNNCIRCHSEMISRINNNGRFCWQCHRRVTHKVADIVIK